MIDSDLFLQLYSAVQESYRRIGSPERILAAFSGGADSTALLLILKELSVRIGFELFAAHVNHGIRASASADESIARDFCLAREIPFAALSISMKGQSENEARIKRYQVLTEYAVSRRCTHIATAHHLYDSTETVFLHMLRGSVRGLEGIREIRCVPGTDLFLWRPLLRQTPDDMRAMLKSMQIPWAEDESNRDRSYERNRLRLDLLPLLREISPQADRHLLITSRVLQDENDYFDSCAREFLEAYANCSLPCPFICADPLSLQHPAMQRRILRAFVQTVSGISIESGDVFRIASLEPGQRYQMKNMTFSRSQSRLHLTLHTVKPRFSLSSFDITEESAGFGNGLDTQLFPRALLEKCTVRGREAGDVIVPFGTSREKRIQDYLIDRKIDRAFRSYIPLLCIGSQVLWAVGVGVSEKLRSCAGSETVFLRFRDPIPWKYIKQKEQ